MQQRVSVLLRVRFCYWKKTLEITQKDKVYLFGFQHRNWLNRVVRRALLCGLVLVSQAAPISIFEAILKGVKILSRLTLNPFT